MSNSYGMTPREEQNQSKVQNFFGESFPQTNSPCPRCGASIEWNWVQLKYLLIHINWHEKMKFWEDFDEHEQ